MRADRDSCENRRLQPPSGNGAPRLDFGIVHHPHGFPSRNLVDCTMRTILSYGAAIALLALGLMGCQDPLPVLDDLQDASFQLVNQDSAAVAFPQEYTGEVLVVGYIYTQCPDVCPRITSNMKQVRNRLNTPSDVRFVSVTFDPRRDTPTKMASYRNAYNLGDTNWQFLTGDSTQINAFMDRMGYLSRDDASARYRFAHSAPAKHVFRHALQPHHAHRSGGARASELPRQPDRAGDHRERHPSHPLNRARRV